MNRQLSPRQRQLVDEVASYTQAHGYPPTLSELAEALGLSITRVSSIVTDCQLRGAIAKERSKARSIRLVNPNSRTSAGAARRRRHPTPRA